MALVAAAAGLTAVLAPTESEPASFEQQVTFNRDIAPILFRNCAACHHSGGAGPFSLLTYQDAKQHGRQIAAVTRTRLMPPWLPEPGNLKFADELRLSDQEIATIQGRCGRLVAHRCLVIMGEESSRLAAKLRRAYASVKQQGGPATEHTII